MKSVTRKLVEKKEIVTNVDKSKVSQSEIEETLTELGKGI